MRLTSYGVITGTLSLVVGLRASSSLNKAIGGIIGAFGWPDWAGYFLWAGVVAFGLVVLIPLSALVAGVVDGRKQRKLDHEIGSSLEKAHDAFRDIAGSFDLVNEEIGRETDYDQPAHATFVEILSRVDRSVRVQARGALLPSAQEHAKDVWALLNSIPLHCEVEIVRPFAGAQYLSVEDTKEKVVFASWGVGCIRLLIEQADSTLVAYPLYPPPRAKPEPVQQL